VTLTIRRPSEDRDFDVPLKRALVEIFSVKGADRDSDDPQKWKYFLDPEQGVGYIRVTSFQENTVDQLRAAIDTAERDGMQGLILDLRFNPGGLLKTAVELTQLFLERDETVVSTKGLRDRPWRNAPAERDGPFTSLPLIVLVNEHSASASEIVSGALQDHGRALIVGERTFGKFSVQKLMQLVGSGAHLKLTTARYYLPNGASLHHDDGATEWGIGPDVPVSLVPKEIGKILTMRRGQDILGPAAPDVKKPDSDADPESDAEDEAEDDPEEDAEDDPEDIVELAEDPNERPEIDSQLNTARLLMKLFLLGEGTPRVAAADDNTTEPKVRNP
jgi:carboxyl-terminal processing protease